MILYKLYRKKKALREKYLHLEFFRSIFPYIRTEYGSPYQSDCGKLRTRKIPNKDTFYAVISNTEIFDMISNTSLCRVARLSTFFTENLQVNASVDNKIKYYFFSSTTGMQSYSNNMRVVTA